MRVWEIWWQGYRTNEGNSGAMKLGEFEAQTFTDACVGFFSQRPDDRYRFDVNPPMTYWCGRLFPTSEEAWAASGPAYGN